MASSGLNRRSVSWQTGLNAPSEEMPDATPGSQMTPAALRLSHLLSQVENPGSPTSPVSVCRTLFYLSLYILYNFINKLFSSNLLLIFMHQNLLEHKAK